MSGRLFWGLAACALAGLVSGVALGSEWLRVANSAGVTNAAMLAPGVVLLGVAIIFRMSILKRGAADTVARFFSRLSWAAIFGAAAMSGTGWLGRWPRVDALWTAHEVIQVFALALTALSFVSLVRNAISSEKLVFKVPASALALASGTIVVRSAAEVTLGVVVGEAWIAVAIVLSAAALRMATITPHRRRKETTWRRKSQETSG